MINAFNRAKTHCPKGHPYSGDNLEVNNRGHRLCRACRKINWTKQNEKAKIARRKQNAEH
jgi:hypothetical protein